MNIVLFDSEEINRPLPVKDERASHIIKVLHKKSGESFDAGIINGSAGTAEILSIDDGFINFKFTPLSDGKPLYPLTLIVGFPRPIQLKRLFRDAAGLGVERIWLCGTELGEKSYMDSNIVERGAAFKALLDGTAQAKSTHVPELRLFASVGEMLSVLKTEVSAGKNAASVDGKAASVNGESAAENILVMLDNEKPEGSLFSFMNGKLASADNKSKKMHVYAAIGSERGWTDNERNLFKNNGFSACLMGNRVLRTETAATVAVSLILQAMEVL